MSLALYLPGIDKGGVSSAGIFSSSIPEVSEKTEDDDFFCDASSFSS